MNLLNEISNCCLAGLTPRPDAERLNSEWQTLIGTVGNCPARIATGGVVSLKKIAIASLCQQSAYLWNIVLDDDDREDIVRINNKVFLHMSQPTPGLNGRLHQALLEAS